MGSETMTSTAPQQPQPNTPLSKRQRRLQGSHPSTTWQQQPRIKSASARARAYISYAGLADDVVNNNNNKSGKSKTLDPTLDLHSPEVKFGRMLGGTDQRSRHHAVKMLREYLRARADIGTGSGISELDLMKLWKGLWYTLYMADKVPVQDKLSQILAELMWCLAGTQEDDEYAGQLYLQMDEEGEEFLDDVDQEDSSVDKDVYSEEIESDDDSDEYKVLSVERVEEGDDDESGDDESDVDEESNEDEKHCRGAHLVSLYIATFLRTVRREWGNVDKHRVDKFYTAVRLMLSEAYKYMAKRYWNMGIVRLFNDVLYEEALSQTPNGLRYHLIDICVEELAKVNKDATVPLTEATFLDCLEPFFAMAQRMNDKNVQKRVMNSVLLKFLDDYSFVSDVATNKEDEEDDASNDLVFRQVHVGTVAKFIFEIASDGDTDVRYRKALYDMHKTFVRKIRAAGRDVDTESGKEEDEDVFSVACDDSPMKDTHESVEKLNASEETPTASSKKKKKKKKKHQSKVEKQSTESSPDTPLKKENESGLSTESPKKSEKKNEEKGATESALKTPLPENSNAGNTREEEDPASSVKSSAKKKKRKTVEMKDTEALKSDHANANNADTPGLTSASKKKKKKQKSAASVDHTSTSNSDRDCKVRPVGMNLDLSPTPSDEEVNANMMSASKRVSFGSKNQSKSHKASMKALKTLTPKVWSTANRTPDKSIARWQPESESKQTKSSSRKKKGKRRS